MDVIFSFLKTTSCVATCAKSLKALRKTSSGGGGFGPDELTPTTVLYYDGKSSLEQCFSGVIERFEATDDVFSHHFLTSWVVLNVHQHVSAKLDLSRLRKVLSLAAGACGHEWNPERFIAIEDPIVTEGPYFLKSGILYQAWRLYPDNLDSFQIAVVPEVSVDKEDFNFTVLNSLSDDGLTKNVAVPSRLYSRPTAEKPLAGTRLSIKDNIKLKGVQTSHQNRSYLETYGPDEESAEYIQKLLELGSIIVGKTKLGAFASAEDPPLQWVDFPCSWSPRGDGYQQPLGSTTGGVTSIVGYPWLDISIGTDTTGSIRAPAAHNGAWGIRTSSGKAASFRGMLPNCPQFDTPGLLARSVDDLKHVAKHSFGLNIKDIAKYPRKILYNTDFWSPSPHTKDYQAIVDEFVKVLETFLNVSKTTFSMRGQWEQNPPPQAEGRSLDDYLDGTIFYQGLYDAYHEYGQFRMDHQNKFNRPPYVTPYMDGKWRLGSEISPEQKGAAITEMHVFRNWVRENIMSIDSMTASDAIMILPQGIGTPWYRDDPVEIPYRGKGYQAICMASLLACPQLIIPIGQVPYHSRITDRTEYLPVSTTIAGAEGSDIMLMNLAQAALKEASWPTEVETGSLTFQRDDNVRKMEESKPPNIFPMLAVSCLSEKKTKRQFFSV